MSADSSLQDFIGQQTHRSFWAWMLSRQVFWVALAAVLACIALSTLTSTFATPQNLFNVTRNFAFVGIMALGMTIVIISGGIDLSVGSTVLIAGVVTAVLMTSGLPLWVAMPAAVGACLFVGLVNGIFIAVLGMPPFVVTLGMMSIARSIGQVLTQNRMIYTFGPDQALLLSIGGGSQTIPLPFLDHLPIPNPLIVLVVLTIITSFVLRWTKWGRYVFALGGNEKAAVLTGVPVKTVKISVYMVAALAAGITGFLETGWLGSVTNSLGSGLELTVIAASVIGGANLAGGIGTALGAVVGAVLIEVIRNSLILLGISTFWQGTFVGSFIVLAVAFDRLRNQETSE
ncbi:MAG TPA: ABC transporter permease [Devosiaceae bacterium]|nr:ABC transporter permease [Devosiaceae bacterium]